MAGKYCCFGCLLCHSVCLRVRVEGSIGKNGILSFSSIGEGNGRDGEDFGRGTELYGRLGGKREKAGCLIIRKYRIFTKLMIEYENKI